MEILVSDQHIWSDTGDDGRDMGSTEDRGLERQGARSLWGPTTDVATSLLFLLRHSVQSGLKMINSYTPPPRLRSPKAAVDISGSEIHLASL